MAKDKQEKKDAVERHRQAREHLEKVSKRDRYESDDYLAANRAVIEAEKNVAWWRR